MSEGPFRRDVYLRLERDRFMCVVYGINIVYHLWTLFQWHFIYLLSDTHCFFEKHIELGITSFIIGLILIILFIFFEELRYRSPFNWIIVFLIVESLIIAFCSLIVKQYRYQLALDFFIWTFVVLIFLIIGSFLPHDLTVDIVVIILIGVISFFGATYFLIIYLVTNVPYSFFVFRALMVFSILPFIMYHAQIINGGRFAEIRDRDFLMGSLVLFIDFLYLFILSLHTGELWTDKCDVHKDLTNKFRLDSYLPNLKN